MAASPSPPAPDGRRRMVFRGGEPDPHRRRRPLFWATLGVGLAIAGAIGVDLVRGHLAPPEPVPEPVADAPPAERPLDVAQAWMSDSLEERIARLRDPENAPLLEAHMEAMRAAGTEQQVLRIVPMGMARSQSVRFHRFQVRFEGGANRFLALVDRGDRLRVDWPAYARAGSASWPDLVAGRQARAEMRVFLLRGDYHNGPFADPEAHECYRIISPDIDRTIYGYASVDSLPGRLLRQGVRGLRPQRVTVQLELPADSLPVDGRHEQFLITRLSAVGWVKDNEDLEESPYAVELPPTGDEEWLRPNLRTLLPDS